jgi:hypothetical protein
MGLDPCHLDAGSGVMLDSLTAQHPSLLHIPQPQPQSPSSTAPTTDPSSLLQLPTVPISDPSTTADDDDFDMYSFLNLGRDTGPVIDDSTTGMGGAGVDVGDSSTAFLDNIQIPQPESEPAPDRRMSNSPAIAKKSGGGSKRKSDVAELGEVHMEVPASNPEPVASGQPPPKRGGVKMSLNVVKKPMKSTKRRREK